MADGGRLERLWGRRGLASTLMLPLAALFGLVGAVRRSAYRRGWCATERLPVPVVVVGNLVAGGTGKTPVVIALIEALRAAGLNPGAVSRGYRGQVAQDGGVALVDGDDAARFGDEIVLVRRRTRQPAAVGRQRARAALALLAAHPDVDVIVADDGLQHYALARDVALAVFDARGLGNGRLLPAGPLREPARRLATVDAIVLNGSTALAGRAPPGTLPPTYTLRLAITRAYQVHHPSVWRTLEEFASAPVLAAAGIGVPERFFTMLEGHGLTIERMALPDHFDYATDPFALRPERFILVTEKDAVKCGALNDARLWAVPLEAELDPRLLDFILERVRGRT